MPSSLFGSMAEPRHLLWNTNGRRKKPTEYLRIRRLLEQEDRLRHFLYIVPNRDLGSFILDCFAGTTVSLFVGFAADFARSFVEMKVIEANSGLTKPAVAVL